MANNTIKSGKTQFNVAEAKSFRDTLAVWHVYDFELSDEVERRNKTIRNCKGLIASNIELMEKLEKGEKIVGDYTVDDLKAQNAQFEQKIADARETLKKWEEGQKSAVDKATALFTKSLYLAYADYINNGNESAYSDAICDFLTDNGLTPCADTVAALIKSVGENKGTGASKAETGKHNRAYAEKTWRQIFMGKVCDIMGNVLPTYKFKNILTREQKKALRAEKSAK